VVRCSSECLPGWLQPQCSRTDTINHPCYPKLHWNTVQRRRKGLDHGISDLHFGGCESTSFLEPSLHGPFPARSGHQDAKTTGVMHSDFVVQNSDLISCDFVGPDQYHEVIDYVVSPLLQCALPFVAISGNHDYPETCSPNSVAQHIANSRRLSFTIQSVYGPVEQVGRSNYYIPGYSFYDENKLVMLLWFFDSRGEHFFWLAKIWTLLSKTELTRRYDMRLFMLNIVCADCHVVS
jgi:hypothetical protein